MSFYKRKRIKNEQIVFNTTTKIDTSLLSLFIFTENESITYSNFGYNDGIDWLNASQKTIFLNLIALVINKNISLNKYTDKEEYLFGLVKRTFSNYYFCISSNYNGVNTFEKKLIKTIAENTNLKQEKNNIKSFCKLFFNMYLDPNTTYNKPQKHFFTSLFYSNKKEVESLIIEEEKKFLGLTKKYFITLSDETIKRVSIEAQKIDTILTDKEEFINKEILIFRDKLVKYIQKDLSRREPNDSSDSSDTD